MQDSLTLLRFQERTIFFIVFAAVLLLPLVIVHYILKSQVDVNHVLVIVLPISFSLMITVIVYFNFRMRQFERQINSILNQGFDFLIFFNKQGNICQVNYSAFDILKYQREELIEQPIDNFLGGKRQKNRKSILEEIERSKGIIRHRRMSFLNKKGEEIWVLANIIPVREGKGEGYVCIAHEIEYQKNLEKKLSKNKILLKSLMNAVFDGLLILDGDGRIQMVNEGHINLFKLDSDNELLSTPGYQSYLDEEESFEEYPTSSIRKGVDKKGNCFYYLETYCPVKDKKGNTIQLVKYERDVTIETFMHDFFLSFHQSNEVRSLVYHLAHELKNPLTIIKGCADLLRIKYPQEEWIKEILHEALLINNMVSSFLGTRRGRGIKLHTLNFEQLLDETLTFLFQKGLIQGLDISKEYNINSPMVEGNSAHFKLVFAYLFNVIRQLIGNGESKGREKVLITIDRSTDADELSCILRIPAVSDVHYQKSHRAFVEIGLSKAREILSYYQGTIRVEDDLQEGLMYCLKVPMRKGTLSTAYSEEA